MSSRHAPRARAATAYVAAATSLAALLTWHVFAQVNGPYLVKLAILAVTVAAVGNLARGVRLRPLIPLLQLAVGGLVAGLLLTGALLPFGSAASELVARWDAAMETARTYMAPVPPDAAPLDPLVVLGGLGLLVVVDLVAVTYRRAPLAGLVLLVIYAVPVSLLGEAPSWVLFTLTAGGFLLLLHLDQSDQIHQWGRPVGREGRIRGVHLRTTGLAMGAGAMLLALLAPSVTPALELQVFDFGRGPGGGGQIELTNPLVDLRRDLRRGPDVPMIRVDTNDPDPGYLRIAALQRFSANEWSSGDRDIPSENTASGELPWPAGLDPATPVDTYQYRAQAHADYDATWLPTQFPITSIVADGNWRYDEVSMDFLSGDKDVTAANLQWEMTAIEARFTAEDLNSVQTRTNGVPDELTELPEMHPMIEQLTDEVTANADTQLEKAVALQDWFRTGGDFLYDLQAEEGSGRGDLVEFLTDRVGYCEQFSAAMAVMARQLGIPSRVAIGFLEPQPTRDGGYVYSAWDLHAWPELWFAGRGWVRFEPTPSARGTEAPTYTRGVSNPEPEPDPNPVPTAQPTQAPPAQPPVREPEQQDGPDAADAGVPWGRLVLALLGIGLMAAVMLLPRLVRGRRRERRLSGDAEQAWAELRDQVLDLGGSWAPGLSPRQRQRELDRASGHRAGIALDRVARAVEVQRYAPDSHLLEEPGHWRDDVHHIEASLVEEATAKARRRAKWWPRSTFQRPAPTEEPVQTTADGELLRR